MFFGLTIHEFSYILLNVFGFIILIYVCSLIIRLLNMYIWRTLCLVLEDNMIIKLFSMFLTCVIIYLSYKIGRAHV